MPRLGIPGLETSAWGTHFCLFYKSLGEVRQLVVSYLQAGLEDGECCVWITAPSLAQSDALRDLERVMPEVQGYLRSEQLHILPYNAWYLHNEAIDPDRTLDAWAHKLDSALRRGYVGLRVAGDASWVYSDAQREAFLAQEAKVTDALVQKQTIALCAFPAALWVAEDMLDIMQRHHSVVVPGTAGWKAVEVRSS